MIPCIREWVPILILHPCTYLLKHGQLRYLLGVGERRYHPKAIELAHAGRMAAV